MDDDDITIIAKQIRDDGFCRIPGSVYLNKADIRDFKLLQASYFRLHPDTNGGNRFRAYQRFLLEGEKCYALDAQGYSQSPKYNTDSGGKVRVFPSPEEDFLNLTTLRLLLEIDIAIAKKTEIVSFGEMVRMGLHPVRYQPTGNGTSYSSPPGQHKDDEPLVFVHLVNESSNVVGGENTIGTSPNQFDAVIKLEQPLETLCVTQRQFHSVVPLGLRTGEVGYRDILLVTFENEKDGLEKEKRPFPFSF